MTGACEAPHAAADDEWLRPIERNYKSEKTKWPLLQAGIGFVDTSDPHFSGVFAGFGVVEGLFKFELMIISVIT